jgi:hypothetical protein
MALLELVELQALTMALLRTKSSPSKPSDTYPTLPKNLPATTKTLLYFPARSLIEHAN